MKITFLNGYLEKDIYMEQSIDFTSGDSDHKVCKLQRSIYGLKQASWSWNIHFNDVIKMLDFIKNKEPCVYKKISESGITFLILYVDNIFLIEKYFFHIDIGQNMIVKRVHHERSRSSFLYSWYKGL